jgi:hemerythrin-like domain-containing protein
MTNDETRRGFLRTVTPAFGAALMFGITADGGQAHAVRKGAKAPRESEETEEGGEVTATEDLMREHGVLRRALLVYAAAAPRLRSDPGSIPPDALQRTATLFRDFGEEYHERKLEEDHILPVVKKAAGTAASYPDVLVAQHKRGREITDYVLAMTRGVKLGTASGVALADVLDGFVRMYQHHAAREDTIVFPAWKAALGERQVDQMGELFEQIERQQFGHDGFETAVKQIGDIEGALGIADIAQFTPPPPPHAG